MSIILRPFQQKIEADIYESWKLPRVDGKPGPSNIIAVAPTGAGKTVNMSSIIKNSQKPSVSIAHRQELVSQISLALAKNEIYHRIIAADPVVRFCISRHIEELGKNYHHHDAPAATAGVQTIIRRGDSLLQWASSVNIWNIDEGHHLCPKNSWGKAANMFPNAFGIGFTATPTRADRKPLGRVHGGMYDHMVLGPTMRELIDTGYLSDYRLFAPTVSIDRSQIPVSEATGDLNQNALRKAAHKSTVTGDIVENYLKFANGLRGIAFVVDVEQAKEVAQKFNAVGVKAMAVSAKTPDLIRQDAIRRFSRGEITVLVNVDLFGEGFDVPAVEVVMMGRPTESFGLYMQQFGRALRLFEGKLYGIIIDHVGNYQRHGLPDAHRIWSLEQDLRGTPRGVRDPDVLPLRRCSECFRGYEAITMTCPYCGYVEEPEARNGPEFVDGDLTELTPEYLVELRGQVASVHTWNTDFSPNDTPESRAKKINIRRRQSAMTELEGVINLWAGIETTVNGRSDGQAYSVFYHKFGVDVLGAQQLKTPDLMKLTAKIREGF